MIEIDGVLISEDIFEKQFVCDLSACKGACCVEGDAGAPLNESEVNILEEIYDDVKPYMRQEGIDVVEKEGAWVMDTDGEYVTPLVNGKECAYVQFAENGTALCAIEQAHREGKVEWKKPISCHLYPIRKTELKDFVALNYHKWKICEPACACGSSMQVTVHQFAKDSLIREFGDEWYLKMKEAYQLWLEYKKS